MQTYLIPKQERVARLLLALIVLCAGVAAPMAPAWAEVRISGTPERAVVDVPGAPIEEVLASLSAAFPLKYRTTAPLTRVITGTYKGSLQRVLSRVLDGSDYFLHSSDGSLTLVVFGTASAATGMATVSPDRTAKPGEITETMSASGRDPPRTKANRSMESPGEKAPPKGFDDL